MTANADALKDLAPDRQAARRDQSRQLRAGAEGRGHRRAQGHHARSRARTRPSGSACRSNSSPTTPPARCSTRAKTGAWDIAFVAIEPVRAAEIDFTAPYVIIEGTYMVRKDFAAQGDRRRRPPRRAHRGRPQVGLRPLSHAHHQERHPRARAGRRRQGHDRHVRQRQARSRRRREAAAGGLCQGPSGHAGDGRPLPWKSSRPWACRRGRDSPARPICAPSSRR